MSVRVMALVWQYSRNRGGPLLVELAIADHAHDDGGGAYPSIAALAKKARISERQAQRSIALLVGSSELTVDRGAGPHGANLYAINLEALVGGDNLPGVAKCRGDISDAGGDTDVAGGVTPMSPKPSLNRHLNHHGARATKKRRKPETPFPENFALTQELRAYALKHNRDPELEL
jgi:hypothetical protein